MDPTKSSIVAFGHCIDPHPPSKKKYFIHEQRERWKRIKKK